jgi:hypothetical protein
MQTQDIYTFALGIKEIKNVYGTLMGKLTKPSILKSKSPLVDNINNTNLIEVICMDRREAYWLRMVASYGLY